MQDSKADEAVVEGEGEGEFYEEEEGGPNPIAELEVRVRAFSAQRPSQRPCACLGCSHLSYTHLCHVSNPPRAALPLVSCAD